MVKMDVGQDADRCEEVPGGNAAAAYRGGRFFGSINARKCGPHLSLSLSLSLLDHSSTCGPRNLRGFVFHDPPQLLTNSR